MVVVVVEVVVVVVAALVVGVVVVVVAICFVNNTSCFLERLEIGFGDWFFKAWG